MAVQTSMGTMQMSFFCTGIRFLIEEKRNAGNHLSHTTGHRCDQLGHDIGQEALG
jgi:hypothetical protein